MHRAPALPCPLRDARCRRDGTPDGGFTLVELLVVIVVIAILAAIAVPLFANQREKAYDAAAKADLRRLVLAITGEIQAAHGDHTLNSQLTISMEWLEETEDGDPWSGNPHYVMTTPFSPTAKHVDDRVDLGRPRLASSWTAASAGRPSST